MAAQWVMILYLRADGSTMGYDLILTGRWQHGGFLLLVLGDLGLEETVILDELQVSGENYANQT